MSHPLVGWRTSDQDGWGLRSNLICRGIFEDFHAGSKGNLYSKIATRCPYGLYAAKGYVSPAFAERTGFTQDDLNLLFEALLNMFENDRSAARGEMIVRGLYDFEHVGTQHENNAEQNRRESRLGCAHAHKLFEGIKVDLTDDAKAKGFPESFADYQINCEWTKENLQKGVQLHKRHADDSVVIGEYVAQMSRIS